jgi:cytochrome c biogenesis protein CcdA
MKTLKQRIALRTTAFLLFAITFIGFGYLTSYIWKHIPSEGYWDVVVFGCAIISVLITAMSVIGMAWAITNEIKD